MENVTGSELSMVGYCFVVFVDHIKAFYVHPWSEKKK